MYRVFLERAAEKDLKSLPSKLHNRIIVALSGAGEKSPSFGLPKTNWFPMAIGEFALVTIASFTRSTTLPKLFA